jgi:hypothetical protein
MSVLWADTDCDMSGVASCREIPRHVATLDGPQSVSAHNTDIAWVL